MNSNIIARELVVKYSNFIKYEKIIKNQCIDEFIKLLDEEIYFFRGKLVISEDAVRRVEKKYKNEI